MDKCVGTLECKHTMHTCIEVCILYNIFNCFRACMFYNTVEWLQVNIKAYFYTLLYTLVKDNIQPLLWPHTPGIWLQSVPHHEDFTPSSRLSLPERFLIWPWRFMPECRIVRIWLNLICAYTAFFNSDAIVLVDLTHTFFYRQNAQKVLKSCPSEK